MHCEGKMDKIREELADVINYCVLMADTCGLDLDDIVLEKIKKNNEKYPVEKAFGSKDKYTKLNYKTYLLKTKERTKTTLILSFSQESSFQQVLGTVSLDIIYLKYILQHTSVRFLVP